MGGAMHIFTIAWLHGGTRISTLFHYGILSLISTQLAVIFCGCHFIVCNLYIAAYSTRHSSTSGAAVSIKYQDFTRPPCW